LNVVECPFSKVFFVKVVKKWLNFRVLPFEIGIGMI